MQRSMNYIYTSLEVISMNSKQLFNTRLREDVNRRTYYSKYIFNSHFLLFLTITIGIFVYSLIGYLQNAEPSMWFLVIGSILTALGTLPSYRSLLKDADGLFLLPYETHMTKYFRSALQYSLALNVVTSVIALAVALLLLWTSVELLQIILFIVAAIILYVMNHIIYKSSVNSSLNHWFVMGIIFVLSASILYLITLHPGFAPLAPALPLGILWYVQKNSPSNLNWYRYIDHEKNALSRYFRMVSMFANVAHVDSQYKRRRYLDFLLPNFSKKSFNKENMYEYLFFRSFMRDHDLPMIILRLIIIAAIVMIWLNIWYVSLIVGLFFIYLIVLQMTQIYSQQAYLLWPKIWPVKRSYIQESYMRYSKKLMVALSLVFAVIFAVLHLEYAYLALIFPLWAYAANSVLSKGIYKKEKMLSD